MKKIKLLLALLMLTSLSACISSKSYVDPQYKTSAGDQIKPVAKKHLIKVEVEFQRNGKHLAKIDKILQADVEKALNISGVVSPDKNGTATIKVTLNNVADLGNAAAKGAGTGLTLGLAGSDVQDLYEVNIDMTQSNGNVVHKTYKHALRTIVGRKAPPANVELTTPANAFSKVVEDLILNFIKDMQKQKLLS
jgi:hypothetical protein